MIGYLEAVREFHEAADLLIRDKPGWNEGELQLRMDLHQEEYLELLEAIGNRDLVETADALADLLYVLCGTALVLGIPLDAIFAEVHRSNMTKVADGLRRDDGKILKGPNFSPPDIAGILRQAED